MSRPWSSRKLRGEVLILVEVPQILGEVPPILAEKLLVSAELPTVLAEVPQIPGEVPSILAEKLQYRQRCFNTS